MRLTFVTYNILDGGRGREQAIGEILAAQNADVILLQEVMDGRLVDALAAHLKMESYVARSNSARHVALLTKLPIRSANSFCPRILRHGLLEATLTVQAGQTLRVWGVHLSAPAYTFLVELYRLRELRAIFERIGAPRAEPAILAGDFNSIAPGDRVELKGVPWHVKASVALQGGLLARQVIGKVKRQGWMDAFRALNPQADGFTLPANPPQVRLDYIFVNPNMQSALRACEVVREPSVVRRASDHLPVRMQVHAGNE